MKSYFKIEFVNQHAMLEPGVDGGGLLKEFLTILTKKMFDPEQAFFKQSENASFVIAPHYEKTNKRLSMFKFIGKIVAKAIYEEILIEPIFSECFLNSLLKKQNHFIDLKNYDQELFNNFNFLLQNTVNAFDSNTLRC